MAGSPRRLLIPAPWLLAAVAIAAFVGYVVGNQHAHAPAPVTAPAAAPSTAAPRAFTYLTSGTDVCSAQVGRRLQLGFEIENQGNTSVLLTRIMPVFPLHGLRAVETRLGTCGQPSQGSVAQYAIAPGGSVWVTTTVEVRVACPAPLPVLMYVDYRSGGRPDRVLLSDFADLATVPYSGCRS